jgi:coenzyme F420-reducing hydrogenase gamma subunit
MLNNKIKKPKLAFISLTSCEGCQFAILDLGKRLLKLFQEIEMEEFRLIKEGENRSFYDIAFIEGNPVTRANFKLLQQVRKRAKILIVLGNCAADGGVWQIKNYHDKNKIIRYVYKNTEKIANPNIGEVSRLVRVDYTVPGCPITGGEFLRLTYELLAGKMPRIEEEPVCYECQTRGFACLLQKGEICLGPITLGGCHAVCLENKQSCWGCRGLVKGANIKSLLRELKLKHSTKEINLVLEIFGFRDSVEKELI